MAGWRKAAFTFAIVLPLVIPSGVTGRGSGVKLWSNVTKADTVGIKIDMAGFPYERCVADISKGKETASSPPVRTGKKGGARWSWLVPGNVEGGTWTVEVFCSGGRQVHRGKIVFSADAGIGPKSSGLWIRDTMHVDRVARPGDRHGNGGGGEALYPVGQCTWWVALKRPDLPFFQGKSGDALNWARSAARHGFPVGDVPTAGAVAVFQPNQYGAGRYGHVAYVRAVSGREITVSETNFHGRSKPGRRTLNASGLRFIYRKGERVPTVGVNLRSPVENEIAQGTVPVTASSNGPGVRFEVFSYADPSRKASGHSVFIGQDTTPADGFSVSWDTTTTPNQGGPGGTSVKVSAILLDESGDATGVRSTARVNVANSRIAGGQVYYPYYVVSTCQEGHCGLNLRSGPGHTEYPITGTIFDGEEIDIVCQAHGENFTGATGISSDIWDKLLSGDWASDYYVDTPQIGIFSPPIPRCP